MKREAFSHPKMQLVARDLQIDYCYARGIIESLWLVAQNNFPQGDIGRWADEEIAVAMGYSGDAAHLIEILRKRKLLDSVPVERGRLYIHDWHIHSDDWVHIRLARAGLTFANGVDPRSTRLSRKEREKLAHGVRTVSARCAHGVRSACALCAHLPSPSPSTGDSSSQSSVDTVATGNSSSGSRLQNEKHRAAEDAAADALAHDTAAQVVRRGRGEKTDRKPRSSSSSGNAALAKKLLRKHPTPCSVDGAQKAIEEENLTGEQESEMDASHERWCAYWSRAQPEFVPNLTRWVRDGDWLRMPPDAVPKKKPGLSPVMQRLMDEWKDDPKAHVDLYKRARGLA